MSSRLVLDNIAIVLCRPRFSENIGAAARAGMNMGIRRLVVVDPERYEKERALALATHAAASVVESITFFDSLAEALADVQYVVGTTARLGRRRRALASPAALADHLIPISRNNRVAVVFGPEDRGLENEDLRLCHAVLTIPTADFSSINLAQSVMIVCYELFRAVREDSPPFVPRLADRHDLEAMYASLKDVLVKISYIQPDNPDHWMDRIRRFFNRYPLRAGEVSIIRGICRQVNWYGRKSFEDGMRENQRTDGRGQTAARPLAGDRSNR